MAKDGKARDARTQGKACHHHRQGIGKARTQGIGNCHRHHRHAIIGKVSARHAIGKARDARTQGIGRTQQQDAGRQEAAKWRSIVIQILKEC
jgi:hypothetical protein